MAPLRARSCGCIVRCDDTDTSEELKLRHQSDHTTKSINIINALINRHMMNTMSRTGWTRNKHKKKNQPKNQLIILFSLLFLCKEKLKTFWLDAHLIDC